MENSSLPAERYDREQIARIAGDSNLINAAEHMLAGRLGNAETIVREVLTKDPNNVNAIVMLADIGIRVGVFKDADALLTRSLELRPDFSRAKILLSTVRLKQQRYQDALSILDSIEGSKTAEANHSLLRANIYSQIGRHVEAISIYETLLTERPGNPGIHMSLAHALKTVGRQSDAIINYQTAAKLKPSLGDAYWSLANLKTYRFTGSEITNMKSHAASEDIDRVDFFHMCFALGKALEDRGEFDEAFWYYQRGNVVRRGFLNYDIDQTKSQALAQQRFFTPASTRERIQECKLRPKLSPTPIFIVGLPRAGSTLVEQILASHSQVEGTQELPDIISIARRISKLPSPDGETSYPQILGSMSQDELQKLGEEYLDRTSRYRTSSKYFIDKMPNNFMHVGLIRLILPDALIVDARRNPMDCCFSGYKQLFARGQNFSYSLSEIGQYYAAYVELMRHWDKVFPGQIIRVLNEDLISNPEREIRSLLKKCQLPFEEACLNFHETKRAIKTASSEQVRQPINSKGVGRWKHYSAHLNPLRIALGDALYSYNQ